jgi:exopolyphosphatase/guanosine-5'-triphosphate,3'-diphosphate pyrophosphatase
VPRFAAVDLGSNALRLRVVEATSASAPPSTQLPLLKANAKDSDSGGFREILNLRAPVRLGAEVFVTGKLAAPSIGQACAALREFRQAMNQAGVDAYRATATSAVREAQNGSTLVERARREAGIELEIIEGVEEARLIQLAVVRRLALGERRALLVDVGGGSTEVTVLDSGQATFSMSLPLGTVRMLETYLRDATVVDAARARLLEEGIDRALAEALPHLQKASFDLVVGTGGNVETLADLCPVKGGHLGFPKAIDATAARQLRTKLFAMPSSERQKVYGLRPDRADTIVPAVSIFLRVAELFYQGAIVAPGVGLKEGILIELVDKYFDVWDEEAEASRVLASCTRLGRRYQFDEPHAEAVDRLASQLFDDLWNVHGLRSRDRMLLRAAAILHDIGDYVRYDGHHKHSQYLIQHSDIMGLSPEERTVVANVARYHRKGLPDPTHPSFRDLDKDARARVRSLAALLRVADALDREHLGKVTGVRAEVDETKRKVVLHLSGEEDRALEEWTVKQKGDLLRDEFGLEVALPNGTIRSDPPPRSKA